MPDTFVAASWNGYHSTSEERWRKGIEAIYNEGAHLIALQEAQHLDLAILAEFSYEAARVGENVVAWHAPFVPVSTRLVQLSGSAYFRPGKKRAIRPQSPFVILAEPEGRTLTFGSIHTPSNVQNKQGEPNDKLPRRLTVLSEAMATLGQVARGAKTHATLIPGDDNSDESKSPTWEAITGRAVTGMHRAVPPGPTMGQRSIDEFRYRRLTVERVWSIPGYGEEKPRHTIIFGEFGWKR